ncbi:MAG: phosphate signaling complex protein PhoU [Bacillus sp. (in: Bacteria)]|jgi:phosphate transport system protein|nr:phosphate signaling complex protein PhoU [Bacillus sp. (in: firmicutes)]
MGVREKFQYDLQELKDKLVELGEYALNALNRAIVALEQQNIDDALRIMEEDAKVDKLEEEINDFAILLIAKQQPVAIDLRRIMVAVKIASDLERIADFAVNIAKSTIRIGNEPLIKPIDHIKKMHQIASSMIELTMKAFEEEDIVKAKQVAEMDDKVDSLYGQTIQELLSYTHQMPEKIEQITQLSFICRYLERTADHVTNITESIFYLVKGRHYDLNN